MKTVKRVVTIVVSILLWMVILTAALYAFTTIATRDSQNVASLAGYTPMVVKSESMAPTFYAGDLIFIRKCDTAKLEEGDIICFHTIIENEYALNTHRIEKIEEQGSLRTYTTKGDNNGVSDPHIISDGDIVGKYVGHVPGLGKVMDFLSSSVGFLLVIVLPMLVFFIYQIYHLINVIINLKKAEAVETAKEKAAAIAKNEAAQNAETGAAEVEKARAEAEAALAEAKRLKAEAEAALAEAKNAQKAQTTESFEVETEEASVRAEVSAETEPAEAQKEEDELG